MATALTKHYGFNAVSRSLRHFFVGKGFKVFSSVAFILLLARYLPSPEFSAYTSFKGLVFLVGGLASVGVQPVLFRYLPELRASGNNIMMYRLLAIGVTLRLLLLSAVMVLVVWLLPQLAEWFKFQDWLWIAPWYMALGVVTWMTLMLSQSLESLLWQKEAQYTLAAGSMIKLVALLLAVAVDEMNLVSLLMIEFTGDGLSLAVLAWCGRRRWRADGDRTEGTIGWWSENKRRVLRFGMWGFLVNQSRVLYGSGPNRLLTAHYLTTADIAILGVADSLVRLMRRSMPARMLLTMIRPVFMARYSATGDFGELVKLSNVVYRMNLLLLVLPMVLLFIVGEPFFDWLTGGKYGAAGPLLGGFLILMVVEGMRQMLALLVQAVEKNHITLVTNFVQSASVLLSIPMFYYLGLWALVVVNVLGTTLSNLIVARWLAREGHLFRLDVGLAGLFVLYGAIVAVVAYGSMQILGSAWLTAALAVICYAILLAVKLPFQQEEKEQLAKLLKKAFARKREKHEAVS